MAPRPSEAARDGGLTVSESAWLLIFGVLLMVGAAVLMLTAVLSEDLGDREDDSGGEPTRHGESPPQPETD